MIKAKTKNVEEVYHTNTKTSTIRILSQTKSEKLPKVSNTIFNTGWANVYHK